MIEARSMTRFSARVAPGSRPGRMSGFVPWSARASKASGEPLQVRLADGAARLFDPSGRDRTRDFPRIAIETGFIPARDLIIIGRVAVSKSDGRSVFRAADMLHLDGFDLSGAPAATRAELMRSLLAEATMLQAIKAAPKRTRAPRPSKSKR